MVQFNTRANEILLKLVYYGPGLSGKTTNLQFLHKLFADERKGELFSVNTQEDRTLFFDLLPINLGYIYGNAIHLQVYTVPGQVQYDASRRVVLGGSDGVVFVADSSEAKMQENVDSINNLYHNLNANRLNIKQIPLVMQYNKRDLPDAMPVGVLNRRLNFRSVPFLESVAYKGVGVIETFLAITRETVGYTFKKYHLDKKIRDFEEMLSLIENNIKNSIREPAQEEEVTGPQASDGTVLRHSNVSVADLVPGNVMEPKELLEDALRSNMETARLYTELKQVKESLEKKNEEMGLLYKQLEHANQENLKTRKYLESLIQSVDEAIIAFSHDQRILTWNAAAERIFGFTRQEVLGQALSKITPSDRQRETVDVLPILNQGQTHRTEKTLRLRKDGQTFPVAMTYSPIKGPDDRVVAYSALVRDLSSQEALKKELEEAKTRSEQGTQPRMITPEVVQAVDRALLAANNLELQTPPGSLKTSMQQLRGQMESILGQISSKGPGAASMGLNDIVRQALRNLDGRIRSLGIHQDVQLDPKLPPTAFRVEEVSEIITHLIENSLIGLEKAPHRQLRVATRLTDDTQQLLVQDSGIGISAAHQARVFEAGFTTHTDRGARGMGLTRVQSILHAMGGRITLRSQEGVGTAVLAELPLKPKQMPLSPLIRKRILVVDGDSATLDALTEALASWEAQAVTCQTALEAREWIEQSPFEGIVADVRLAGINEHPLYFWMKAHKPELAKHLLVTFAEPLDSEARTFLDANRLHTLPKPFDLMVLKGTLEQIVL